MKSGSGQSLELHSTKQKKQIVRIDKKGDFNINTFHMKSDSNGTYFIIYSDCEDTQIFKYGGEEMSLLKMTKKVCHTNDIPKINAAKYVYIF
jgi:hypothetical protein